MTPVTAVSQTMRAARYLREILASCHETARERAGLCAMLEALGDVVVFASADGAIHRPDAGSCGLDEGVRAELELLAGELAHESPATCGFTTARHVRVDGAQFRLAGCVLADSDVSKAPRFLFIVRRLSPVWPCDADLADRFGLTPQECRVARLLADGSSNADIARTLCISPHTARRHTENILTKLGIRSRARVAAAMLAAPGIRSPMPVARPAFAGSAVRITGL